MPHECQRSVCVCVWWLCPVYVDHSTWPVWRHQGHRRISCPLMSACRRIQQVSEHLWHGFTFIRLFVFFILLGSVTLCLSVIVLFCPSLSLSLCCLQAPLFISLSPCTLFVHEHVFSASWLIFPAENCTQSADYISAAHLIVLSWYPDTWTFYLHYYSFHAPCKEIAAMVHPHVSRFSFVPSLSLLHY